MRVPVLSIKQLGFTLVGLATISSALLFVSQTDSSLLSSKAATTLIKATEGLRVEPGAVLSFESHNGEGMFWRHEDDYLHRHSYSDESLYKNDASFYIETCINGAEGVSFRSVNYPDHYVRHKDSKLRIARYNPND